MRLSLLITTSFLTAEYDAQGDCLFIHLHNRATPAGASLATVVEELPLPVPLPTRCLVLDSWLPTKESTNQLQWLVDQLLPKLYQAGIRRWLWVCQITAHGYRLLEQIQQQLPYLAVTPFYDVEQAANWLRYQHPPARRLPSVVPIISQNVHQFFVKPVTPLPVVPPSQLKPIVAA